MPGWLAFLAAHPPGGELIVVDDGSTDDTVTRVEQLADPRLRVVRHATPQGEGAALRSGLGAAHNPLVFYTLCHPDYRPADLTRLLEAPMDPSVGGWQIDHVHLMSGYRAGVRMPLPLRVVGWVWRVVCVVLFAYAPPPLPGWLGWRRHFGRLLARVFFGLRAQDVSCPFRLMRRDILARMPVQSDGPFAHVELLAKANFLGHLMGEEVPIPVVPGPVRANVGQVWREARRLFDRPDFGPPVLPAEPPPPADPVAPVTPG